MKKYLILLLTSLIIPFQLAANSSAPMQEWSKELKTTDFSGQVMVAHKGKIVFAESYGIANREKDISFERNSVFDIGSITKQFVATAILKLEEQGKLKVSDHLSKFLPDTPSDKQSITLHHLLTQQGLITVLGLSMKNWIKKPSLKKPWQRNCCLNPGPNTVIQT